VDMAYLPGQETLLVGFLDGSLQLYDLQEDRATFSVRHFQSPVWYLAFSYTGEYMIIQRPYELEIRRASDGSLVGRYASTASAVSSVRNDIAYGSESGELVIQNLDSLQVLQRIPAHTALIYAVQFSPDGASVITSGQDCDVRLWDAATGAFLHDFYETAVDATGEGWTESRIFLYNLNFVPERHQVVGFGSWGTVVSWDTNSGATQYVLTSLPSYERDGMITIHPQFLEYFGVDLENDLLYINQNGFDIETGALVRAWSPPAGLPADCAASGPVTLDGELRFTLGYNSRDGLVCVLDAATNALVETIQVVPPPADQYYFLDWLYLSPDGRQLVLSAGPGVIYVYQVTP